ncbi:MAG: hypothetical protein AAF417_01890, partial [Pseudomonadota bacterium]
APSLTRFAFLISSWFNGVFLIDDTERSSIRGRGAVRAETVAERYRAAGAARNSLWLIVELPHIRIPKITERRSAIDT